jgi:hypothetical protein
MNEPQSTLMWLNHFDLLPGDPSVSTSFNAISSGVGGGLTGLIIRSNTTGEIGEGGATRWYTWPWRYHQGMSSSG